MQVVYLEFLAFNPLMRIEKPRSRKAMFLFILSIAAFFFVAAMDTWFRTALTHVLIEGAFVLIVFAFAYHFIAVFSEHEGGYINS